MSLSGYVERMGPTPESYLEMSLRSLEYHVKASISGISEVSNTTAALQSVKRANPDDEKPTVTIISKHAVAEEVYKGELYEARIYGFTMSRKFYIVYSKDNKNNVFIDNVVNLIISGKC